MVTLYLHVPILLLVVITGKPTLLDIFKIFRSFVTLGNFVVDKKNLSRNIQETYNSVLMKKDFSGSILCHDI